ncbi:MAG: hypothetical protein MJY76_05945 [Bacteroidales bacterium]|nr:hypothetical protein [Bacteroidales bacterium]
MEKDNYFVREQECTDIFNKLGPVYNACTDENHPVIFRTKDDFKAGMSIMAICVRMFEQIKVFAFQLMSNHIHLVISGNEQDIMDFFNYFKDRLDHYLNKRVDLSGFCLKLFAIEDLAYFRNAIVYVNRNGFVVYNNVTPFSYPWGTSAYFFQPLFCRYVRMCGKAIGNVKIRQLMHTKNADSHKDIQLADGYVHPLEFCLIELAEQTFHDAKQYFYLISRKIETYASIAKSIGEYVFYSDSDLFLAASKIAKDTFGAAELNSLTAQQKIELAKRLHFDYNASEKQLQRLLKIDKNILKSMF